MRLRPSRRSLTGADGRSRCLPTPWSIRASAAHGPALLALEDGTIFPGVAFGAPVACGGDLVVNTSQTGYQEVCTDPSYAGQVVVMTYPAHRQPRARSSSDDQSERPWLRGLVVGHATAAVLGRARQIVHLLRASRACPPSPASTRGRWRATCARPAAQRAIITAPGEMDVDDGRRRGRACADRAGRTRTSSARSRRRAPYEIGRATGAARGGRRLRPQDEHRALASPPRRARARAAAHRDARRRRWRPDVAGLVLSPGPGRPGAARRARSRLAQAVIDDGRPLLGICLGHQIVGRAAGAETRRLRFGHHGANHPVRDLEHRPGPGHGAEPRGRGRRRHAADDGRLQRQPAQPQRRLGRGAAPRDAARSRPSSTTPRARPARSTRSRSSTASWRSPSRE